MKGIVEICNLPLWCVLKIFFLHASRLNSQSEDLLAKLLTLTRVLSCIRDIAKSKKSRTQGLLVFRKCHFGCAVIFVCPKLSLHFYFRWGNNSSVIGSQNSLPHGCSDAPKCFRSCSSWMHGTGAEFHSWGKQIFSSRRISSTLSNLLLSTICTTSQPNCEPQNSTVLYNYEVHEASWRRCCNN